MAAVLWLLCYGHCAMATVLWPLCHGCCAMATVLRPLCCGCCAAAFFFHGAAAALPCPCPRHLPPWTRPPWVIPPWAWRPWARRHRPPPLALQTTWMAECSETGAFGRRLGGTGAALRAKAAGALIWSLWGRRAQAGERLDPSVGTTEFDGAGPRLRHGLGSGLLPRGRLRSRLPPLPQRC